MYSKLMRLARYRRNGNAVKGVFIAGILLFIASSLLFPFNSKALAYTDKELDKVLGVADQMFKAMKEDRFSAIWLALTEKSKSTIVADVTKEQKKLKGDYTTEQIKEDFEKCGPVCRVYWRIYLIYFNPDMALNESKWDVGFIKKDRAEILITHNKSNAPARLKMFKENGEWKVGLVETFWNRK